jgi:hypothetical protein
MGLVGLMGVRGLFAVVMVMVVYLGKGECSGAIAGCRKAAI